MPGEDQEEVGSGPRPSAGGALLAIALGLLVAAGLAFLGAVGVGCGLADSDATVAPRCDRGLLIVLSALTGLVVFGAGMVLTAGRAPVPRVLGFLGVGVTAQVVQLVLWLPVNG